MKGIIPKYWRKLVLINHISRKNIIYKDREINSALVKAFFGDSKREAAKKVFLWMAGLLRGLGGGG